MSSILTKSTLNYPRQCTIVNVRFRNKVSALLIPRLLRAELEQAVLLKDSRFTV